VPSNDVAQLESAEGRSTGGVQRRGRCAKASDLLVLVHVRLTESFETQDPNAATVLLDQSR
jgi:hypothetical protein